jgi:predicted dehydrogenase
MTDPRRVALIGLGSVAEPHLVAYEACAATEVVAVVEPRADRLARVSRDYGVPGYGDVASMLANARPDIACVLTPVATHRAIVEQCAAAGVHVLCEKPMANSVADAIAMARACEDAGVRFCYGSSYRYLPAVVIARAQVASGVIGSVRLAIEQVVGGEGADAYRPMSSAHYPEGMPGGGGYGLVDHGVHMLDILPWMCGTHIIDAIGRGDRTGSPALAEFAVLHLAQGGICLLAYDGSTRSSDLPWEGMFGSGRRWIEDRGWIGETGGWQSSPLSIRIHGDRGSLRVFPYANRLFLNREGAIAELALPPIVPPYHFAEQIKDFCVAIDAGRDPACGAAEGIAALRVLDLIYRTSA